MPARRVAAYRVRLYHFLEIDIMGKYALAWLLGVPGIVLVLLFIVFR